MQRTRDWRRHQFEKRRRRDHRLINAFHWCYRSITREEQSEENYEAIRRGGFKRSFIKYWLRDGWIIEGKIERRNGKKPKVADEWEAWYD